jgi:hypothetical protein
MRHGVEFEDLDTSREATAGWTREVFSFSFSSTRRLWRLGIAESAKSFHSSIDGQNG